MTWNEREEIRDRLMENIADFMIKHGSVKRDREQSNYYCSVRMIEVRWHGQDFNIIQVDGKTCRIDKE